MAMAIAREMRAPGCGENTTASEEKERGGLTEEVVCGGRANNDAEAAVWLARAWAGLAPQDASSRSAQSAHLGNAFDSPSSPVAQSAAKHWVLPLHMAPCALLL